MILTEVKFYDYYSFQFPNYYELLNYITYKSIIDYYHKIERLNLNISK